MWLQFYWDAFSALSTERQIGMGVGPIPRSAICDYAHEHGLSGDMFDKFVRVIMAVDSDYTALINSPKKRTRGGKGDKEESLVSAQDVIGAREVLGRLQARSKGKARGKP